MLHETTASLAEARQQVRSPPLQGADGKQVCCRPATAVKLLWPAVNPALGRRDFGDLGPIWVDIASETGTGRAPAGITKGFPTALISSDGEKVAQRTEGDRKWPLNDTRRPRFRDVPRHGLQSWGKEDGGRASRNGLVSDLAPEAPPSPISHLSHRGTLPGNVRHV